MKRLCFHRYRLLGYYPEALRGECLILTFRCLKCGKEKVKSFPLLKSLKE